MMWSQRLGLFSTLDLAALGLVFLTWAAIGYAIDHPPRTRPSVSALMAQYRRQWMIQMIDRQPRVFDAQIITSLRQGTSFFGSATLLAIGGSLALLGNIDPLIGLAGDLSPAPEIVWEFKVLVILVFLTNAFLKFVWSNRLFGYCAVLMAAVPNSIDDPLALPRARKAGEINITAARGFNRGLRSLYFALATAAWLLGPGALLAATLITAGVLLRREFASRSRAVLLLSEDPKTATRSG